MSSKPTPFTEELQDYILQNAVSETDTMRRLREVTASHPMAIMQISPLQGALMAILVKAMSASRILEVGTFTGYSALVMAQAAGDDARVVTLDLSEEYTDIAREFWKEAGMDGRIELRLGPAAETMAKMLEEGDVGSFDLAFIDANKEDYPTYFAHAIQLVKRGGVILLDNMFRDGQIVDEDDDEEGVVAIRRLYEMLKADNRVDFTVISVADGLGFVLKKEDV